MRAFCLTPRPDILISFFRLCLPIISLLPFTNAGDNNSQASQFCTNSFRNFMKRFALFRNGEEGFCTARDCGERVEGQTLRRHVSRRQQFFCTPATPIRLLTDSSVPFHPIFSSLSFSSRTLDSIVTFVAQSSFSVGYS